MESLTLSGSEYPSDADEMMQRMLNERRRLLESIDQYHMSENPNTRALFNLKSDFNKVVFYLNSKRTSPFSDPLDALPYEIWIEIIYNAVVVFDWHTPIIPVNNLLQYSLVSPKWRNGILSTPNFWTDLYIADKVKDIAIKIHLNIFLSKESPIKLILKGGFEEAWKDVGPSIAAQSHRVQSILLIEPSHALSKEINIMNSFQDLKKLTTIIVSPPTIGMPLALGLIFQKTPSLQCLKGVTVVAETLLRENLGSLRTVSVDGAWGPFQPSETWRNVDLAIDFNNSPNYEIFTPHTDIPLLWESLTIKMFLYTRDVELLLGRTAHSLHSLTLSIHGPVIASLFSVLGSMPLLRDLSLRLQFNQEPGHDFSMPVLSPSLVKRLTLFVSWSSENQEIEDSVLIGQEYNVGILFNLLVTWAPNVEDLKIDAFAPSLGMFEYVESLIGMSHCELAFASMPRFPLTGKAVSLKTPFFKFTGDPSIFEVFSGSEVLSIQLRTSSLIEHNTLNGNYWPSLRHLELWADVIAWDNISLPHLQRISIGNNKVTLIGADCTSGFIEKAARDLAAFPSLEILEFYVIPEWDLLFIMLERHNCSLNHNLARIRSISIPTTPSLFILKPLTQLLRGELPILHWLFEYSRFGVAPAIFYPSPPGCYTCHLSHLSCEEPVQKWSDREIDPERLKQSTKYPTQHEVILTTWKDRLKVWISNELSIRVMKSHSRDIKCSKHDSSRLCEITGDTLEGSNISHEVI